MELLTAVIHIITSSAVIQSGAGTTLDPLIAALLISLALVLGSSWWIFRRRSR